MRLGIFVFGLLASASVWAQSYTDDVLTFTEGRRLDRNKDDLNDDITNLRDKSRELRRPVSRRDIEDKQKELDRLNARRTFARAYLEKIRSGALKTAKDSLKLGPEDLKKLNDDKKLTKPVNIEGSPFQLIADFTVSADRKLEVKYSLKLREDTEGLKYQPKLPKSVDVLDKAEQERIISDEFGKSIVSASGTIGTFDPANPTAQVDAANKKSEEVITEANDVRSRVDQARYDTENKIEDKKKEIADAKNDKDKQDEIKSTNAKLAVAEWLKANDPKDLDSCQVLLKALKGKFTDLPGTAQQQCSEYDPVAKAKRDAEEKAEKEKIAQANAQQAQKVGQEFGGLVQHCLDYYKNQSAQAAASPKSVIDPIQGIYEALLKQGFAPGCNFFGELAGNAAIASTAIDLAGDVNEDANRIVGSVPNTKDGVDTLKKEKSCTEKIVRIAGNMLSMVAGSSPYGLNDPQLQGDPKVQTLIKNFAAAQALLRAIDEQMAIRLSVEQGKIQGINRAGTAGAIGVQNINGVPTTNVPVVGGGMVGGTPTVGRPSDRRNTNRTRSNSRSRLNR